MAGIFVSYRRDDSQGFAGRLADDLADEMGKDRVFRDIEIPIGADFEATLQRAIAASDALIVVIGPRWAAESAAGASSRLFEPNDWVRAEIEAAFAQGKSVIPVLVGTASMPDASQLPPSITRLARLQAAVMSDLRWDAEIKTLAARLRALCPALAKDRSPSSVEPTPADVLRDIGGRLWRRPCRSGDTAVPMDRPVWADAFSAPSVEGYGRSRASYSSSR
jgi:hypothetical protein